ncbi:MAG: Gldg family protein [Akkermansiaceae bacterium]|nr:Gldg family protein [Verrucomicrobiales bacterium]
MNQFVKSKTSQTVNNQQGQSRISLLLVALLCAGLGAGAVLLWRGAQTIKPADEINLTTSVLSESTRSVLKNLKAPVEVRFYSLLDATSVSDSVREFSGRVDQLLSGYERESGGKISIVRHDPLNAINAAKSASADGIRPFNIDQGDACFFGIAVIQNQHKESLPQLSSEWESALEADLTRAIARVSDAAATVASSPTSSGKPDRAVLDQVKQLFPNLETLSLEDGKRRLRESALKEFTAAAQEMEVQIKDARQRLGTAQASQSEAQQKAAAQELQQLQTAQSEKLKEIAARSLAQVEALESLKQAK